jgi:hypothetical protein
MSVDREVPCVQMVAGLDETVALLNVLRWAVLEAELTGEKADVLVARHHPEMVGQYVWAPNLCTGSH